MPIELTLVQNSSATASRVAHPAPELSIIIPTFNERSNVRELIERIDGVLTGCSWEAIFVDDDSSDGTVDTLREIARRDHRVRYLQRIGRRGLSTACIEGMLSSSARFLAVMDADLQHDETLLADMLNALRDEQQGLDIVIGSRYVSGGETGEWNQTRVKTSRFATRASRLILKNDLADPMSGFFMIRRDAFHECVRELSGFGFKILLDLFASSPRPLQFRELPYTFRTRQKGESKLDNQAAWHFGMLLLDKMFGRIVPVRFLTFSFVGFVGVAVHLAVQAALMDVVRISFPVAQAIGTLAAMTWNFAINNVLTYRDMQLRGIQWLRGWVSFTLACGIGAVANVGIASYIYDMNVQWVAAAVAGILVSSVWNYAVTKFYTWKKA